MSQLQRSQAVGALPEPSGAPDVFSQRFGSTSTPAVGVSPAGAQALQGGLKSSGDVPDVFSQRFGSAQTAQKPTKKEAVAQPPSTLDQIPQPAAPSTSLPGQGWDLLQMLGAQGIKNANAMGRGISDVFDAPSEWLAAGAEKSGLTGLLGKAGINMPTAEQQQQLNAQSRTAYDAANPEPGVQGTLSRIGGNIGGVMVPVAGAEAALTQGGRALANATKIAPETAQAIGTFLSGQGGLASRIGYNAAQGAAGGALLSGGQSGQSTADAAGVGALLGGAVPVVGGALRYGGNLAQSLTAPFTTAGREGIAQRLLSGSASKYTPAAQAADAEAAAANAATPSSVTSSAGQPAVTAESVIGRAGTGGRNAPDLTEYVPGSQPTLSQATGNGGIAALERAAKSRAPNEFTERELANYSARNDYLQAIKGTPDTLAEAVAARDAATAPLREASLAGARPANTNPVIDTIDDILKSPEGQRDAVVSALGKVRNKLDLGEGGAQSDVAQLYGIRKSIGDQLEKVAGKDNTEAQQASRELIQVRDSLDQAMEKAAPGFENYRQTYADLSKPINAQSYLQNLNLTDATSNRITLPKVKDALARITKLQAAPGANEAKSITPEQMGMLQNLHKDLQREANNLRGMSIGSNTFQNLATNQLIDSLLPGRAGAFIGPITPGALGTGLGMALGGPAGAAMGGVVGQGLGNAAGRAMNAQSPEIEAKLINFLLNPKGVDIANPGSVHAGASALNKILSRSVSGASGVTPNAGNNR